MISGKKIFLTGGAGFIGTKLCQELADNNLVYLYDNLRRNSYKESDVFGHKNVQLIEGDILDDALLKDVINKIQPQIIVHLAAVAGIDTVIKSPTTTMKVNMVGTYNILESLVKHIDKVERFIDISTSEVFGSYAYKVEEVQSTNLAPVGEARWTYSVSKLAGEHLSHSYYKEFGLPVVSIRPFNIYGPGQVGEGAIHVFVTRALRNEDLQIHGDGDQIRSWCYIEDFIQGIMLALENKKAIGNVFNIGNPRGTTTINDLAEKIILLCNSKSKIIHVPKNYVDVELRIPSIDKAKRVLGYNPVYDLTKGLIKTIEWYKKKV